MEASSCLSNHLRGVLHSVFDSLEVGSPQLVLNLIQALLVPRELRLYCLLCLKLLVLKVALLLQPLHFHLCVIVHVAKYVKDAQFLCQLQIAHYVVLELFLQIVNVYSALPCEIVWSGVGHPRLGSFAILVPLRLSPR